MIIAIIVLSILLCFSFIANIIFYIGFKNLYILTMGKTIDLKKEVKQKFENITLIVKYIPSREDMTQIIDMSQYEEKQIIGLTIFAQEQELYAVAQQLIQSPQESEEIMEMLREGFIVPHATLYQLKDGVWIWD